MEETCTWTLADVGWNMTLWKTSCEDSFRFNSGEEGGPKSNLFRYCPYCGKALVERWTKDDD